MLMHNAHDVRLPDMSLQFSSMSQSIIIVALFCPVPTILVEFEQCLGVGRGEMSNMQG